MSKQPESAGHKRRGRRPGGADTREALLQAARDVFTASGYDGATVREIAGRAGADPAMVNHWFGGKENLFAEAVLELPLDPNQIVADVLDGDLDSLGERIVRRFLTVWDEAGGGVFAALIRSVAGHEQAKLALRDLFVKYIFGTVLKSTASDQQAMRATLCATQIVGLGMVRYVAEFEPLTSAERETLVTAIAPTVQRYLTGSID